MGMEVKGRSCRGRLGLGWGSRSKGRPRDGGSKDSTFYSSGHSSVDDGSFHDESCWIPSAPESFGWCCSFGSDLSSFPPSPRSTHLAGCEPCTVPGLDLALETRASNTTTIADFYATKYNVQSTSKEGCLEIVTPEELQQEERTIDPLVGIVPHSLRDNCQNQRVTFESLSSPSAHRRWRPGSLDLNGRDQNAGASSLPSCSRGAVCFKNNCVSSFHDRSSMLPSPGTPNCWHSNVGVVSYQKGWSSERVPLPASRGQRYRGNSSMFPYNSGRTLPSKWEDAERWICSPLSGIGSRKPLVLPPYYRRPKSKSGPLGAPVMAYGSYASTSPQIPCFDNGRIVNFAVSSPFLAGVLMTDQQLRGVTGGENDRQEGCHGGEKFCSPNSEVLVARSARMRGNLGSIMQPSISLSSDVVFQGNSGMIHEIDTMISPVALSRNVGTQMSPERSAQSSPKERPSLSQSPLSVHTTTILQSHFPCLEIRDVQVDDQVTITRFDREEANITAWENLQKAKAEAALQKLEMKLEKKRSSSMEKILNRLRSAERKAQDMRSSVVDRQVCVIPRAGRRISYFRKNGRMPFICGCFTCHAF